MENIFRSLSFTISQLVYPLISYLYDIFERIAKHRFFSDSDIENLSQNIYIVISACMLFTLGLKLISAIVNPDALDGGNGGTGTKRSAKNVFFSILISLFLIIMIPIGFKVLYQIQNDVLNDSLVEKIILGADVSEDHAPGQILASYSFASFCHPQDTVSTALIANDGGNLYNLAISENIEYIRDMDGVINSKTDGEYDMEYNAILSPAVGIFLTYEMILICIDIALRSIKLGLLELITSVVLCGYVVSGTDLLKRWAKEVMSTYLVVFLKIAAMSFMVYGLSLLEDFLDRLNEEQELGFWSRGLLRVFVIIGLLQLVKQIPDLINKIFGTNIKSRGGIRGRLGEMAAVGDLAQRAWDQVRTHPLQTGQRLLAAPVSAVGGYFANRAAVNKKADAVRDAVYKETGDMDKARRARREVLERGMAGSFGAMFRAGRAGFQNGNLQGIGAQRQRYEDTHPTDMLVERANMGWGQRLDPRQNDNIRAALGMRTRLEEQQERDKRLTVRERSTAWKDDKSTSVGEREMTVDEAKRNQARYTEMSDVISKLSESASNMLQKGDSGVKFKIGDLKEGNFAQVSQELQARIAKGDMDTEKAAELSNQLNLALKEATNQVVASAVNGSQDMSGTVLEIDDGSGGKINLGSLDGKINMGTFDGMRNDVISLQQVMESLDNGIDGYTIEDLNGEKGPVTWSMIDEMNISSLHHAQDIGRALSYQEREIENRVSSVGGRAMQQSSDLAHQNHNNGGNNNGGNNG